MNLDPEFFSGRVFRLGSALSKAPGWYRDAFVLGMHSPANDRATAMKLIEGIPSAWVIDESEFEHQPKREPALLYSRAIPCSVGASEFLSGYFKGVTALPESVGALYSHESAMPWGGKGSTPEARAHFLAMLGDAIGPEGDVWRDPELSFENYAGRALIGVAGGFEESLWFMTAGFEADPRPILQATLSLRAELLEGQVLAIDGPWAIPGPPWPGTGMILASVFRDVRGGDNVFEDRFVTLKAWTGVGAPSRQVVQSDSQGETTVVAELELVVELHVPLVAAEGVAAHEYQFPWIDKIMETILALDESDGAWMYDDGEENGDEYIFFIAASTEEDGLALAARLARLPGLPAGIYATVSTADPEEFGIGQRVDLGG